MRITIREVAREAGVSITAASRALNGKGELRPEKRAQVLAAAHRLHYTPSSVARALVSSKSKTLGVMVTSTSPVYADILHGIEKAAHAADYGVLFANSGDSQEQALRYLQMLHTRQVDGVLLTSVQTDRQAVGVLKAARTLGLRIPDDLALTGGDDIELEEFLEVPLTTFRQPARQIGTRATQILIARLQGEELPTQHVVLKPQLVVRRSSGCPV